MENDKTHIGNDHATTEYDILRKKERPYRVFFFDDAGGNDVWFTEDDASGREIAQTAYANPYGYTGRRWDAESGLWYFRNRMYDAELGRFISRDPAGYVDGMNLYASYFAVNGMDAYGLCTENIPRSQEDAIKKGKLYYVDKYGIGRDVYPGGLGGSDTSNRGVPSQSPGHSNNSSKPNNWHNEPVSWPSGSDQARCHGEIDISYKDTKTGKWYSVKSMTEDRIRNVIGEGGSTLFHTVAQFVKGKNVGKVGGNIFTTINALYGMATAKKSKEFFQAAGEGVSDMIIDNFSPHGLIPYYYHVGKAMGKEMYYEYKEMPDRRKPMP